MIDLPTQPQDEDIGEGDAGSLAREGERLPSDSGTHFNAPPVKTQEARIEIRSPPSRLLTLH